jgi:hypothetical protein
VRQQYRTLHLLRLAQHQTGWLAMLLLQSDAGAARLVVAPAAPHGGAA